MALPKVAEVRQLSDEELTQEIVAVRRELFDLRFQKATRQQQKGDHAFKHARHRLAQLMTVQQERRLAADAEPSPTAQMPPATTAVEEVEEEVATVAEEE